MEYRQILDWVNKEDWSALLDVGQSQIEKLLSEQKKKYFITNADANLTDNSQFIAGGWETGE